MMRRLQCGERIKHSSDANNVDSHYTQPAALAACTLKCLYSHDLRKRHVSCVQIAIPLIHAPNWKAQNTEFQNRQGRAPTQHSR